MAIFTFTGQDANNTANAGTLVVNNELPLVFTINSGAESYVGNNPNTVFNEAGDDRISYVGYGGNTYTNVTFVVTYEGSANWSNGNSASPAQYTSHIAVIRITSGAQSGQTYTLILGNGPDPAAANPHKGTVDHTFKNGNHRATPAEDGIFCFTRGTLIATPDGAIEIEALSVGDIVTTADHGPQEIRWIGSTTVAARGINRPVRFAVGSLGAGTPTLPLLLSPAHRVVVSSTLSRLLFDCDEPLVHAEDLVNDATITRASDAQFVQYFHLLFDHHEVIFANGAKAESFHPGEAVDSVGDRRIGEELARLFPEKFDADRFGPAAHPTLSKIEARLFSGVLS